MIDSVPIGSFLMKVAAHSRNNKAGIKFKGKSVFSAQAFLDSDGLARKVVEYRKSETIYSQGEPTENVLYIQKGGIKLSVVNEVGKEAIVAMLGPGDFFGEGGMAGSPFLMGRETGVRPPLLLVIEKRESI